MTQEEIQEPLVVPEPAARPEGCPAEATEVGRQHSIVPYQLRCCGHPVERRAGQAVDASEWRAVTPEVQIVDRPFQIGML